MAIIRSFSKVTKEGAGPRSSAEGGYAVIDHEGTTYLVLESYGSEERARIGKSSQSFHLDRQQAAALHRIIEKSFPGIE